MRFLFFTLCFLSAIFCSGQTKLLKFGKVSLEELKMKQYDRDTTAHAVILYDRGYFNGNNFTFTRHLRLKILKAPGTTYANFTLKTPMKSFIDGYTFNLQNGVLVKTKLENSQIYTEEIVQGFDLYKVFFSDVKPGSVIDLEYSHEGLPFEWRFQDIIPVVFSELIMERTQFVQYKNVFYGFEQVKEISESHWVAEHVPPLRQEPLMNQYSNFLTRCQFDIEKISISSPWFLLYKDFSSWESVGKRLMELEYFGGVLRESAFLNEKARELRNSNLSTQEKITEAARFIKANIKWNNSHGLLASRTYREDFTKNHSGSSTTINLLLISLLKKADINTYPVVLSTRDNGMIHPLNASINKLNYVVAFVNHEKVSMLIDATTPHTVPGILPEHCLNLTGWMIHPAGGGELMDLSPHRAHVMKQFIMIKPNESNELVAEVSNTYEDYAFLDWIKSFEKAGSEASYESELRSKTKSVDIDKFKLGKIDRDKLTATEITSINLASSDYVQDIGSELLISPFIFSDFVNPFKSSTRQFPIDFVYPRKRSIIISMSLPKGYTIKGTPKSTRTDYPEDKAKFSFLCNASENMLNIRCDFSINETVFTEEEHEMVKAFFSEAIKKMNESIQVVKKT